LNVLTDTFYFSVSSSTDLQEKLNQLQAQERARAESGEADSKNAVTPESIAAIVSRHTGVPVTRMLESEKQKLLKLDRILAKSVVGQEEAVHAVASAIRLSRSGLANPNQPSSFLFCGPSGTGKTLLSKSLAKGESCLPDMIVDMSVSRILF